MSHAETPEVLAQMAQSADVRIRGRGVIAQWLAENTEIPDVLEAAQELIKTMGEAGLVTMIKADLNAFIGDIKAKR